MNEYRNCRDRRPRRSTTNDYSKRHLVGKRAIAVNQSLPQWGKVPRNEADEVFQGKVTLFSKTLSVHFVTNDHLTFLSNLFGILYNRQRTLRATIPKHNDLICIINDFFISDYWRAATVKLIFAPEQLVKYVDTPSSAAKAGKTPVHRMIKVRSTERSVWNVFFIDFLFPPLRHFFCKGTPLHMKILAKSSFFFKKSIFLENLFCSTITWRFAIPKLSASAHHLRISRRNEFDKHTHRRSTYNAKRPKLSNTLQFLHRG